MGWGGGPTTLLQKINILVSITVITWLCTREETQEILCLFYHFTIKVNSDRCMDLEVSCFMLWSRWGFYTGVLKCRLILVIKVKSPWFHKVNPKTHDCTSLDWTDLKWIWGICFRDDNGNCVGRCLQALFWNEAPCFASTDKLISKYSSPSLIQNFPTTFSTCSCMLKFSAEWCKQYSFCFSSLLNLLPKW